jgi:hypothetical protein
MTFSETRFWDEGKGLKPLARGESLGSRPGAPSDGI